ncbi:unnamed protein product [Phytomonas sp. EM1]|nr:unnamed protein product [Phytomonas sp. EM1]|eukprot:CCW63229.1 unnamed protein product [Phytomonas sp. isolate EM1]
MEHNDFEFPPDPVQHNFAPFPSLQSIPISVLAQTPVDQLPPTTAPTGGNYSIRQIMRSAMCFEAKSNLGGYRNINAAIGADNSSSQPYRSPLADPFTLESPSDVAVAGRDGGVQELWQRTGRNRRSRAEWTEGELRNFYHALSQYGTDFAAISVLFPGRSRADVKLLYRREMRKHPNKVRAALQKKKDIDLDTFEMFLKEKRAREQPPKKVLALEEEQLLQQIAQVESPSQDHTSGGGAVGSDVDDFLLREAPRGAGGEGATARPSVAPGKANDNAEGNHVRPSSSASDDAPHRPSKRPREVDDRCDGEATLLEMALRHPQGDEAMTLAKAAVRGGSEEFDFPQSPKDEFDDAFSF